MDWASVLFRSSRFEPNSISTNISSLSICHELPVKLRRTFELRFTRWSGVKKLEAIQKSSNEKHQFLTKWVFQAAYICIIWMLRQMRVSVIINSFSKSFYKWCSEWVRTFLLDAQYHFKVRAVKKTVNPKSSESLKNIKFHLKWKAWKISRSHCTAWNWRTTFWFCCHIFSINQKLDST